MKHVLLTLIFGLALVFQAEAQQISKHALGLRLGDDDGFDSLGGEISYQLGLSDNNRLEFALGIRSGDTYDAFKAVGLYQWVMPLDRSFHWYVGAGAGLGSVDVDGAGSSTFALLAGDIGIEYNFKIPLLLSLDVRPEIGFGDEGYGSDFDFDLGLGIRYQF
nr:hypothetical protein [uncultured Allomuricauda sp.]